MIDGNVRRGKCVQRLTAWAVMLGLMAPLAALPAQAQIFGGNRQQQVPAKRGMSTGKKVALVAGAALLYYLYKKHQATQTAQANQTGTAASGTNARQTASRTRGAQLYRSKNGGVYYRDPQGKPVWLTVPNQAMQVPQSELQRYAPDYARYKGPAPAAPAGYRTQAFSEFNQSLLGGSGAAGGATSSGAVGGPPGPSGR